VNKALKKAYRKKYFNFTFLQQSKMNVSLMRKGKIPRDSASTWSAHNQTAKGEAAHDPANA
jgi:hypothetical protein